MADITIRHTRADGTLIEGSARGDGVWESLKSLHGNWRYFRSIGQIGVGQSRDNFANTHRINAAAEALRAAGHTVTVDIDDTVARTMAEQEADRAARAERRAEGLAGAAERRDAKATADYDRAHEMAEVIPFGQPVMPDHYSYGRDMRYRNKIHDTYGRAFAGMDEAKELARRAEAAEANQSHRESIPATLRRIAKLEAEERGWLRTLDGRPDYYTGEDGKLHTRLIKPGPARTERINAKLTDVREQLAYWREHVKAAEANGVKVWGAGDFAKGDFVRTRYGWAEVLRVNAKSVSIPWNVNHRGDVIRRADGHYPRPWPYDEVRGRKTAEEMATHIANTSAAEVTA